MGNVMHPAFRAATAAKLFRWSVDGWQSGLPPKSGTYLVRWEPGDAAVRVVITLCETQRDGRFAVWRYFDLPEDDPEVYPGDTPEAQWLCQHHGAIPLDAVGAGLTGAVCENCGATGQVISRDEIALFKRANVFIASPDRAREVEAALAANPDVAWRPSLLGPSDDGQSYLGRKK